MAGSPAGPVPAYQAASFSSACMSPPPSVPPPASDNCLRDTSPPPIVSQGSGSAWDRGLCSSVRPPGGSVDARTVSGNTAKDDKQHRDPVAATRKTGKEKLLQGGRGCRKKIYCSFSFCKYVAFLLTCRNVVFLHSIWIWQFDMIGSRYTGTF
jgi:hypothetical protein